MKKSFIILLALIFPISVFSQKENKSGNNSFLDGIKPEINDSNQTKQTVKNILSRQAVYHNISFAAKKNLLAFSRRDRALEIRDINTGHSYCINTEKAIDRVIFSPGGNFLAGSVTWDNQIIKNEIPDLSLFDVRSKKWQWTLSDKIQPKKEWGKLVKISFNPGEDKMAVLFEQKLLIVDTDSAYLFKEFEPSAFNKFKLPSKYFFVEDFLDIVYKGNNEIEFITGTILANFNIVNKILGKVIPFLNTSVTYTNIIARISINPITGVTIKTNAINGFVLPSSTSTNAFLKNNYVISYFSNTQMMGISDGKTKDPVFYHFPGSISDIELDTNQKIIYYTLQYNSGIYRFDYAKNIELPVLKDHSSPASDIELVMDKKWIISSDINGVKNFWSTDGTLLFRMVSNEHAEYMISTPQNYYQCSKGILKDLRFMKGNNIYRFESFDHILNRPDIILKQMGSTNSELITNYETAVKLRAEKTGFNINSDPNDLKLPKLVIKNKNNLTISTSQTTLTIDVDALDENSTLKEILIYVNGIKIQNIAISKNLSKSSHKLTVKLTPGTNFVEVSCININGRESLRESHEIVCTANVPQKVYFLGVGVSNYKETDFNLQYAAKDVRDLVKNFKSTYGKNLFVDTLINKNATLENFKKSILKLSKSTENDLIIVSLNGHGLLDKDYNFYFGTYDVEFLNPSARGISFTEIDKMFEQVKARNRIVFIDACHSGELDKNEVGIHCEKTQLPVKEVKFRGSENLQAITKKTGISTYQIMRDFFSDLSAQSGSHIIAAAGGFEYAMESDQWHNGVFTYSVLQGLKNKLADEDKNGVITVEELQRYVQTNVVNLTNGKQLPASRKSNFRNDFTIIKD